MFLTVFDAHPTRTGVVPRLFVIPFPNFPILSLRPLGALQKWRQERGGGQLVKHPAADTPAQENEAQRYMPMCERIVVLSKRDLVGSWGIKVSKSVRGRTAFS